VQKYDSNIFTHLLKIQLCMVLKGSQNYDTMALKTLWSYFIASCYYLILCVVFVYVHNWSQHPSTKVEMLFHRSWRNTAASATAKHLGNTFSAEPLCSPESLEAALHFTLPLDVSALTEFFCVWVWSVMTAACKQIFFSSQ